MSDIPPEVWANIIGHLRQPIPDANEGTEGVTWKQLHQHDLASMMRVSKTIHALTAPILYAEIVLDKPSSVLVGIDRPFTPVDPSETPPVPFHKRHLLAKVTTAHYIYSSADEEPYGPSLRWPKPPAPGDSGYNQVRDIYQQVDFSRYIGAEDALLGLHDSVDINDLFPRLHRRTIGLWQTSLWSPSTSFDRHKHYVPWDPEARMQRTCEMELGRATPIPLSTYDCQNAFKGPLMAPRMGVPYSGREIRPAERMKINSVHNVNFGSSIFGQIYPGIENHLYVPPRKVTGHNVCDQVTSWMHMLLHGLQQMKLAWNNWSFEEQDLLKTKTIFLLPRDGPPPPRDSEVLCHTDQEIAMLNSRLRKMLGSENKTTSAKWTDGVSFAWADSVPEYKGCGRRNVLPEVDDDDEDAWEDEEE